MHTLARLGPLRPPEPGSKFTSLKEGREIRFPLFTRT
jgi:hypothetical protein